MSAPRLPEWRHCKRCDVKFKGDGPCFSCGTEAPEGVVPLINGTRWVADLAKGAGPV